MVVDFALLLLFIVALRLLDAGIRRVLWRCLPRESPRQRAVATTTYALIVIVIAAPIILATLHLHPQKIGCAVDPSALSMDFEEVTLEADGRRLAAWYIPGDEDAEQVIVAHGVGANKANFLPVCAMIRRAGLRGPDVRFPRSRRQRRKDHLVRLPGVRRRPRGARLAARSASPPADPRRRVFHGRLRGDQGGGRARAVRAHHHRQLVRPPRRDRADERAPLPRTGRDADVAPEPPRRLPLDRRRSRSPPPGRPRSESSPIARSC